MLCKFHWLFCCKYIKIIHIRTLYWQFYTQTDIGANLEALGMFERRYNVLSCIASLVVGFLCSDFYNVVYS